MLTLAGAGALQGRHCLDDLVPAATNTTHTVAAATGQHAHDHEQLAGDDHGSSDTASDICLAQPAATTPATVTTAVVQPPAGLRTLPIAAAPAGRTPRLPRGVALIDIGVSRT